MSKPGVVCDVYLFHFVSDLIRRSIYVCRRPIPQIYLPLEVGGTTWALWAKALQYTAMALREVVNIITFGKAPLLL